MLAPLDNLLEDGLVDLCEKMLGDGQKRGGAGMRGVYVRNWDGRLHVSPSKILKHVLDQHAALGDYPLCKGELILAELTGDGGETYQLV